MKQNGGFPRFVKGVKGSLIHPYTRARNGITGTRFTPFTNAHG